MRIYLKPQICRRFIWHHMRTDINPDNLSSTVKLTWSHYLHYLVDLETNFAIGILLSSLHGPGGGAKSTIQDSLRVVDGREYESPVKDESKYIVQFVEPLSLVLNRLSAWKIQSRLDVKGYSLIYLIDRSERCLVLQGPLLVHPPMDFDCCSEDGVKRPSFRLWVALIVDIGITTSTTSKNIKINRGMGFCYTSLLLLLLLS